MTARNYPKPPIREALVEFHFADDGRWNWTYPGRYWGLVRDEYDGEPRSEQTIAVRTQVQARSVSTRAISGVGRVFLTQTNGSGLLGLAPLRCSIHVMGDYPGWDDFRPRIERALTAYGKLDPACHVSSIGLRYVNRIVIPGAELDLEQWFTSSPTLPGGVKQSMNALMSRVETTYEDGARLAITLATVQHDKPDQNAFLLDLDLSWTPEAPVPLSSRVYDIVDSLHDREGTAFEAMITDTTRGLFK